jgi:hypothetical protein
MVFFYREIGKQTFVKLPARQVRTISRASASHDDPMSVRHFSIAIPCDKTLPLLTELLNAESDYVSGLKVPRLRLLP